MRADVEYLDVLEDILHNGEVRTDRTGVGTIGVFGRQMRFDLSTSFPLLTTKKVYFPAIVSELLWFLRGDTNIAYLHEHNNTIWDEWADEKGELGPVYGKQWRSWSSYVEYAPGHFEESLYGIDQITALLYGLRNNPFSRRHIVTAWNPAEVDQMALPPCHLLFQFYVTTTGKLSCQLYQRSADMFLGVPFNIASYALLTYMIAKEVGLEPGEFVHTLGDAHIYLNHIKQVKLQLHREPYASPTLVLADKGLFDYEPSDIKLENYVYHPRILAPVAV